MPPASPTAERLSAVVETPVLYHGTTLGRLAGVLAQGLQPRAVTGAASRHITKTTAATFLTDTIEAALIYASPQVAEPDDAEDWPVVLEINVEGLDLDPDYDDVGVLLDADLGELGRVLKTSYRVKWKPVLAKPVPAGAVAAVEKVLNEFQDNTDRGEPTVLELVETAPGVHLLYAKPYVRLPLASEVNEHPDVLDWHSELVHHEGESAFLAQQYLHRGPIPTDRIRRVFTDVHAIPNWKGTTESTTDFATFQEGTDEDGEDSGDFLKRKLAVLTRAEAARLAGAKPVGYGTAPMGAAHPAFETEEGMVGHNWGSQGAGLLFGTGSGATARVLILRRSNQVLMPGTCGPPGGAVGRGEPRLRGALREGSEEVGHKLVWDQPQEPPAFEWKDPESPFVYTTYVVWLPTTFAPRLNWENTESQWVTAAELAALAEEGDLHPAFADALAKGLGDLVFGPGVYPSGSAIVEKLSTKWASEKGDEVPLPVTIEIKSQPGVHGFNVYAWIHPPNEPPTRIGNVLVRRSSDQDLATPEDDQDSDYVQEQNADCHYEVGKLRKRYRALLRPGADLLSVTESHLDWKHQGEGIGVAMYVAAVQEAAKRGALLIANTCEEGGQTSREADRVWGSKRFREAADVDGWVAFARPPAGQVGQVEKLPRVEDEPDDEDEDPIERVPLEGPEDDVDPASWVDAVLVSLPLPERVRMKERTAGLLAIESDDAQAFDKWERKLRARWGSDFPGRRVERLPVGDNMRIPVGHLDPDAMTLQQGRGAHNARVLAAFRARRQALPGGQGDNLDPGDVSFSELLAGQHVEMEHTTDPLTAIEIALDHLAEDAAYYTKLATIHQD